MTKKTILLLAMCLCLSFTCEGLAMKNKHHSDRKAIVLACFGTTYPTALKAILNLKQHVEKAYPNARVKLAFTSNIIRRKWHHRRNHKEFFAAHPGIPMEIVNVKGPLATIADLQDEGYRTIIVQPTHIYFGEEYIDLSSYVEGLNTIKTIKKKFMPFEKLVLGRPLLGKCGIEHDYHDDLTTAAKALASDVALARKNGAALVYMGHGNEFYSTGAYIEFQQVLRKMYPGTRIFVGTVEGYPALDNVVASLEHAGIKKVLLKPFMIVAGDHANNDMAGDEPDSWKNVISKKGITVIPVTKGIGENSAIAAIYVQHIRDAAVDNGIKF